MAAKMVAFQPPHKLDVALPIPGDVKQAALDKTLPPVKMAAMAVSADPLVVSQMPAKVPPGLSVPVASPVAEPETSALAP